MKHTFFITVFKFSIIILFICPIFCLVFSQQPTRTTSSVDTELVCICGENSMPYAERVRLIHRLPSNLAPEQLERCRAFLESPPLGRTAAPRPGVQRAEERAGVRAAAPARGADGACGAAGADVARP